MRRELFLEMDPFEAGAVQPSAAATHAAHGSEGNAGLFGTAGIPSACLGLLQGFDAQGQALVRDAADLQAPAVPARTTVPLHAEMIGDTVVVVFEGGDRQRPIVLGVVQRAGGSPTAIVRKPVSALVDDERVLISAEREIVLQCGQASITLTRAGRVVIKGAHILSHARGYNRIKGSAVDIN